jgi:Lipase (class 3)
LNLSARELEEIDPSYQGFDLGLARLCARVCGQSYRERSFENLKTGTQVLIRGSDGSGPTIIAFRGSSEIRDWLTNVEAWQRDLDSVEIHAGFYAAVDSVWGELETFLLDLTGPIVVTGHSLGAALAQVFAFRLSQDPESHTPHAIYTFGGPRVGDKNFAKKYNLSLYEETFRVIHQADLVPWVPWLLGKYRHAGQEVYLGPAGTDPQLNPSLVEKLLPNALELWRDWKAGRLAALADHPIGAYVAALSGACGGPFIPTAAGNLSRP